MFQIRLSGQRIYESINNAIWSKPEAVTEVPETLHYRLAVNKFHDWELLQDIHSLWAKWFIDMTSHLQEKKKNQRNSLPSCWYERSQDAFQNLYQKKKDTKTASQVIYKTRLL